MKGVGEDGRQGGFWTEGGEEGDRLSRGMRWFAICSHCHDSASPPWASLTSLTVEEERLK